MFSLEDIRVVNDKEYKIRTIDSSSGHWVIFQTFIHRKKNGVYDESFLYLKIANSKDDAIDNHLKLCNMEDEDFLCMFIN